MFRRCKQTEPLTRNALTLLELLIAMSVMAMVVGTLGGLAMTVQQGYEYSEGYGLATQHARVVLDRIAQNASQATASEQFPGCLAIAETVGAWRYPDTLVVWRPSGTPANPSGLPQYNELVVYCPNPKAINQFVEITAPTDTRTVPAVTDTATWRTQITAMKTSNGSKIVVLSDLLRTCSTAANGTSGMRGAVRFETRLRPSATDWANYKAGTVAWKDLPWVQGIYGTQAGQRQVWLRTELQLSPGTEWTATNPAVAQAVPYLGSAALYYELPHP